MPERKNVLVEAELISLQELPQEEFQLMIEARKISENSYSPYSTFKVGAAVLLENGTVVCGANQENSAYPSGLCAERVALFYAKSQHPATSIKAIAITARPSDYQDFVEVTPCGSCRQVMSEFEDEQTEPFTILLEAENNHVLRIQGAYQLLPFRFNKKSLKGGHD
jgi:cytidine deaminase